jgi:GNAT superfamily N-acetyltransferase
MDHEAGLHVADVIREFSSEDAEAVAALVSAHSPWLETAAGLVHRLGALPARAQPARWVAEADGEVVAWGEAEFDWSSEAEQVGHVWVLVDPAHRGRGIGSRLFETAVDHLTSRGARELRTWSFEESAPFLERRSFERRREERVSAVDPRTVDTSRLDELEPGVRVVRLADLLDRLPEVYALYAEAAADMPADHAQTNFSYEEWLEETVANPTLSHEGSVVVLVDDRPAALSWVDVDFEHRKAEQELTGTAQAYRRRGLARLAKLAVLRWCAAEGIERLATGNDGENAGMLAINYELGFRPDAVETEWAKRL